MQNEWPKRGAKAGLIMLEPHHWREYRMVLGGYADLCLDHKHVSLEWD